MSGRGGAAVTGAGPGSWTCRTCRLARAAAAVRRWTPTVFGYAMLVSLLAAHFLPPVWAATRPAPTHSPTRRGPPPGDTGGGGGRSGGNSRHRSTDHQENGGRTHKDILGDVAVAVWNTATATASRMSPSSSPSSSPPSAPTSLSLSLSPADWPWAERTCQSWGGELHRLVHKRSTPHQRRQHPSSHRSHSPHHPPPAPSLTSLAAVSSSYSFSPPSSSSSLLLSSPSSSKDANARGLPQQAPLEIVIQQQQQQQQHDDSAAPQYLQQHQLPPLSPPHYHQDLALPQADQGQRGQQDQGQGPRGGYSSMGKKSRQNYLVPGVCDPQGCVNPLNYSPVTSTSSTAEGPDGQQQCKPLTPWMADQVCKCQTHDRLRALSSTHLHFCSSFPTCSVLSCASRPDDYHPTPSPDSPLCEIDTSSNSTRRQYEEEDCRCPIQGTERECRTYLQDLVTRDKLAEARFNSFEDLLGRYDCSNDYSVRWECQQCRRAYKEWVCASTLPYYKEGRPVRPCSSFCQQVVAMCPFFPPKKETHAGDPSFLCKGPGMDEVDPSCFQLCHLVSPDDIRAAFCGSPEAACSDVREELELCPEIRLLPARAQSDNETGSDSHHNATSAATGSAVLGHHVTRTAVGLLGAWVGVAGVVVNVGVGVIGAQGVMVLNGVMEVPAVLLVTLLWMTLTYLTAFPYSSCLGLT